jgi:hypothetical protein
LAEANGGGDGGRASLRGSQWGISAAIVAIGLLFGLYNGIPWPSKDIVAQLVKDVQRIDAAAAAISLEHRQTVLSIQAQKYEVQQLRDHVHWLEGEVERLKEYVYPKRSGQQPTVPYNKSQRPLTLPAPSRSPLYVLARRAARPLTRRRTTHA